MDSEIRRKERDLEVLEVDDEIASRRMSIAEKRAVEKEMKKKYGRDWRKVLGMIKVNTDTMSDLYAINPDLKDLSRPMGLRRL